MISSVHLRVIAFMFLDSMYRMLIFKLSMRLPKISFASIRIYGFSDRRLILIFFLYYFPFSLSNPGMGRLTSSTRCKFLDSSLTELIRLRSITNAKIRLLKLIELHWWYSFQSSIPVQDFITHEISRFLKCHSSTIIRNLSSVENGGLDVHHE